MFHVLSGTCAAVTALGIGQLNPEAPGWASVCIAAGIGWLFGALYSIERKIGK